MTMQMTSVRVTYCGPLTSARHDADGSGTASVTGFRPGKLRPGSSNGTASSPAGPESGIRGARRVLPGQPARFPARPPRRPGDADPGPRGLQPGLAGPRYDDAPFAEALTGRGGAGDERCDAAGEE
jgi:hypothetical protein